LAVSRLGTLSAARLVHPTTQEQLILLSLYSVWERPHPLTGSSWIYADASAHRLLSDLATFIGRERNHRIIAAGDLNILFDYGEAGSSYWRGRYLSIFQRAAAMGLALIGPRWPHGRRAEPWPAELPEESVNVPTYYSTRQTPASATRQLDFVFASTAIAPRVTAKALNAPEEWHESDHCQIHINIE
jgi:exonuclease III